MLRYGTQRRSQQFEESGVGSQRDDNLVRRGGQLFTKEQGVNAFSTCIEPELALHPASIFS
jgi:hypothetical protein